MLCNGVAGLSLISIHAPVKGATRDAWIVTHRMSISIHAPVKGATIAGSQAKAALRFQSTLP